jgi:hypothetical protein
MEKDEAWEPTTRIPVLDEDILEVCKQSCFACHQQHAEGLVITAWSSLLLSCFCKMAARLKPQGIALIARMQCRKHRLPCSCAAATSPAGLSPAKLISILLPCSVACVSCTACLSTSGQQQLELNLVSGHR